MNLEFPEHECAIVGSMIVDPSRIDDVLPIVDAKDFANRSLRALFVLLVDLHQSGTPISEVSIIASLRAQGSFDRIGGHATISAATLGAGNAAHAAYYAAKVRSESILRQVQEALQEAIASSLDPNQTPAQLLDFIDSRLMDLRRIDADSASVKHIADTTSKLCDEIDMAAESGSHRGIRTGLDVFDQVNGGFQNGTLNVIAARPSNGKSVLAQQFAEGIGRGFEYAFSDGRNHFVTTQPPLPTLFVSLEMTEEELASRSLASATRIDGRKINSYRVTEPERKQLRDAAESMQSMKLHFWEPSRVTVSAIRAKARLEHRQRGLACLVIDYLQLIDSERGSKFDKETYRIGEICRHLKQLAKELDIPVVVCCQLNRDAENQKPTLAQLSDSGKIEQHADTITAIHRIRGNSEDAVLQIMKWRNGQTPEVEVTFDRKHLRFMEPHRNNDCGNYEPAFADYAGASGRSR